MSKIIAHRMVYQARDIISPLPDLLLLNQNPVMRPSHILFAIVGEKYLPVYEIPLVAGHNFTPGWDYGRMEW